MHLSFEDIDNMLRMVKSRSTYAAALKEFGIDLPEPTERDKLRSARRQRKYAVKGNEGTRLRRVILERYKVPEKFLDELISWSQDW